MLEVKKDNLTKITLDISSALSALGKTTGDITDVAFMAKLSAQDTDASAVLSKTLLGGGISLVGSVYVVTILDTDFANMAVGKKYIIGVGILYSGLTKFLELDIDDGYLIVKQDIIRA